MLQLKNNYARIFLSEIFYNFSSIKLLLNNTLKFLNVQRIYLAIELIIRSMSTKGEREDGDKSPGKSRTINKWLIFTQNEPLKMVKTGDVLIKCNFKSGRENHKEIIKD